MRHLKNSTDEIYTKDGKADRITILQHIIYPSDKEIATQNIANKIALEKLEAVLGDHYDEFVDFCNYLSDNTEKPIDVSSYMTSRNEIIFEIYDGHSISELSFREENQEVS